jgi:hypothetical protein
MKKLLFTTILTTLLVSASFCMAVEIALEAELADEIVETLVVAETSEAAAQGGPEPSEPSSGKFVWAPGPPVTGGGGEGYMEFIVNIPQAGTYAAWGRVTAWDGNSDSFWVTWTPADPEEDPQETQNTEFRWSVAQANDWQWDRVNQWLDGGTFEREWDLPQGESTLRIWSREDASMLDCLFITDNLSEDEAEVSPRVPTAEDISKQTTAVSHLGKLSTTWAAIRISD